MDPTPARTATLVAVTPLARDTRMYRFALDEPLPFEAGQFVNLTIPGASPRPERSYSIWSDPAQPEALDFAIKLFPGGQASEYLRDAPVGTTLGLRGPYGHFTLRPAEPDETVWMFATSTGLAPFHSMLSVAARARDPRPFRILFGCREPEDVFALPELDALARVLDLQYTLCFSRLAEPSRGPDPGPPEPGGQGPDATGASVPRAGRLTCHLPEVRASDRYYLCGNGAMIAEARDLLKAAGADRKRIHFEKYW